MGNPLRAIFGRALAAGASSLAKDAEAFVKEAETDAEKIARIIKKGRQALTDVAKEIDEAVEESRKR